MRFTDEIIFVKRSSDSKYDPDLGEWVEGKPERTRTEVNVTDIGTDRSVTVFGSVKEGAKVIRTQPLFSIPEFDYIEFEGKTWQVTTARNPSFRNSLIVQEVIVDESTSGVQGNRSIDETPEESCDSQ
ncbi:hypothetical protein A5816_001688 [Enterococcus sp. 3G1_DIV0629]|uniref:hypothetical protein n=1 Tax=Enterococcus sp. (strain 3G1_DIV0629) TaxID=1834176 RepID=UPI000A340B1F|nr:hypothetical protein [Enterococcus sp. 3G1_DIV0629]OTO29401.1 hypothetical protein A5816_001688 [Enterococcus sp. 3G1_DIV0629]